MSIDELTDEPTQLVVSQDDADTRLDVFLASQFTRYSRVKIRTIINAGGVTVGGRHAKASYRLAAGDEITIVLPEIPVEGPEPEDIPLDILFEDEHLVAINKPPGMVVHPSKGHWSGTLTAALAFHFEKLSSVGGPTRPGIVHRLDRDTSGVIVIAKTDHAHMRLAAQFEQRTAEKEYFAIVAGALDRDRDVIDAPIGMHPYQRDKMAIRAGHPSSRDARTFYEVVERFNGFVAVKLLPKTGRTHQIRVHLDHVGCPVLCDRMYGGRSQITFRDVCADHADETVILDRHALHACRLRIAHPETEAPIEFTAPLPDDIVRTLGLLRKHRAK